MSHYAAVFDMDGVLLDSESNPEWLNKAVVKTLDFLGLPVTERNMEYLYPRNIRKLEDISKKLGVSADILWDVRNKFYKGEKIKAIRNRGITPFDDIKYLYLLKDNYEVDIISNSPQEVVDIFISEFGYDDLFTYSIGRSNRYQELKPNASLFEKFIKMTSKKDFYYIGDRESDRLFAEKTGMYFIMLDRSGKNGFNSLREVVDFLLKI